MTEKNGVLHDAIAIALQDGELIVVSNEPAGAFTDLRPHILDDSLSSGRTFEADGKWIAWRLLGSGSLDFQNYNRPSKTFLLLPIPLTVICECTYQKPGWAYRLTDLMNWVER